MNNRTTFYVMSTLFYANCCVAKHNEIGVGHHESVLIHLFNATLSAVVPVAEIPHVWTCTMVPVVLTVTSHPGASDI